MKKLTLALIFFVLSILYLLLPSTVYAGTCFDTTGGRPEPGVCYDDTVCPKSGGGYYKIANVTYTFTDGSPDCTRSEHMDDSCASVIYPTCQVSYTCQRVAGDNTTVDCVSPSICLPAGYDSTNVCSGRGTTTSGGGCIQVQCSYSSCVNNQCQAATAYANGSTNWNNRTCQTTNSAGAGYCAAAATTAPGSGSTTTPAAPAPVNTSCIRAQGNCGTYRGSFQCCGQELYCNCEGTDCNPTCGTALPVPVPVIPAEPVIPVATPAPLPPWIQTTGGDVHSNTGINAPGGP